MCIHTRERASARARVHTHTHTQACTIIMVDIPTPAKLLRTAMPDGSDIPEDIVGEEGEEAGEEDVVAEVVEEHEPLGDEQP